jgi:23S rRNA (cytosine1962-C5)-methyltransferase
MEAPDRCSNSPVNTLAADPLAQIAPPSERRLALRVTPDAQRALRSGHPWLFDRAIISESGEGQPGDLAVIFDDRRRFLAIGLYDPTSPIRVRVLHCGAPEAIDRSWLRARLTEAVEWRAALPESGTTGYRLVHGENDGLPGLVIDRYDATLVVKLYSLAWIRWLAMLREVTDEVCPAACVVLRLGRDLQRQPDHLYGLSDGAVLAGPRPKEPVLFTENALHFEADVLRGQKTGFFLDQRDNRARVEKLASGRRTLNVFAYSGGFSLYAARGGAPEVLSLDASAGALASAERNFALNRHLAPVAAARHTTLTADAFAELSELHRRGRRFDLVIVDPPAFAKQESETSGAIRAYGRLTGLALGVLAPGGTLVMSSCSSRVSARAFFAAVHGAAAEAGRPLDEIDRTGHPIDHPVRFPEGAYLKCLYATA